MTAAIGISVVIAAWNAAPRIQRAVASALASYHVNVEVIIVDDASSDDTWRTLQDLAASDARIVIDRLPANSGPSVARNRATILAKGEFIAILDADDAFSPHRLAHLVDIARKRNADIVVDNMLETDASGRPRSAFLKSPLFAPLRCIDLETWIAFNQPLKPGDCLGYLKPLIRRTTLARLNVAYDPALRNSEDYYLVANLLAGRARMIYTPEPGYLYTRAAGSTSHRLKPEHTRAWLSAEAAFQQRHTAGFTLGQQHALGRRARALRNVNHLVAATAALKARQPAAFLGLLVSDISAAAFTLRTFTGVAIAKLLRRGSSSPEPAA